MKTLFNPFSKYLNPRDTGLITFFGGGGGGSSEPAETAPETPTASAPETPSTPSTPSSPAPAAPSAPAAPTIDTSNLAKQADMNRGFATSEANQNKILSDTGQIKSDTSQIRTDVTSGFADVGNQLSGIDTNIDDSREQVSGQIDDLSASVDEKYTTGMAKLGDGFAAVGDTLDTGFADVGTQFNDLNTNLDTQFETQNQNLTDMSSNILGGQASLQDYLSGFSDRQDAYYGGLADGQANILSDVGGLQSNFTDFRKTYDDNTTLANQTRNQLIDQVVGGFEAQEQRQAENTASAQQERSNIAASIGAQQEAAAQANAPYAATLRNITAGAAPTNDVEANAQADVKNRISAVQGLINTVGQNLSPELREQYQTLAESFDQEGRLIPVSQDGAGNVTQRALDNQSNLLSTTVNSQRQVIDQRAINVDRLLSYMDELGYAGTQAPSQLTSNGLMGRQSPYINTFG